MMSTRSPVATTEAQPLKEDSGSDSRSRPDAGATVKTASHLNTQASLQMSNTAILQRSESEIEETMSALIAELAASEPRHLTTRTQIDIYIVYFSVFLDNMGVSIVQPILPFYAESFGANSLQLGMLYSSYSFMATLATIFMAKMSDKFGRRPMIIFSLFGTMTGFLLTGFAWNYESLLVFRFYTGAFGGSFSVAQAYMTDICPKDVLEKYLAGIGGIMAIAFIIGPLVGSVLAQFGLSVPFFASSAAGLVGFLVACFFLQESYFPQKAKMKEAKRARLKQLRAHKERLVSGDVSISVNPSEEKQRTGCIAECRNMPMQVWLVLVSYFLATIGWCTFTSMFAQYLIDAFGLNSSQVGIVTVIIGTVYVFANVVVFTFFAKRVGIYWTAAAGLVLFAVSLGLCPLSGEIWGMLIFMCLGVGIGNGVLMPCMSAMGADFSDEDNRGTVLGWITVGNQSAFVVGPLLMGWLYGIEPDYIFYVGAGFAAAAFIPVCCLLIFWPQTRKPKTFDKAETSLQEFIDHPERWSYRADKPSKADCKKMGSELSRMLIARGYQWVTHYDRFSDILDLTFPPIRTEKFEDYYEDCRMVRKGLEQVRFDFDHVHNLQQVSFMGEAKTLA